MDNKEVLKDKSAETVGQIELIHVISDSTRIQIMKTLSENGEMCARDILAHFSITQPTLSHHMSLLSGNGLVEARKSGRWVYYRLCVEGIRKVALFFESLANGSNSGESDALIMPIKSIRTTTKRAPMLPTPKKSILRPEITQNDEDQDKKEKKKSKNKDGKKNKKKNKKKK